MFCKKSFLKNLAELTEKHLCWILFLIMLQAHDYIKKRLRHRFLTLNFDKLLRTTFYTTLPMTVSAIIESTEINPTKQSFPVISYQQIAQL